jgi:hypothetical protein
VAPRRLASPTPPTPPPPPPAQSYPLHPPRHPPPASPSSLRVLLACCRFMFLVDEYGPATLGRGARAAWVEWGGGRGQPLPQQLLLPATFPGATWCSSCGRCQMLYRMLVYVCFIGCAVLLLKWHPRPSFLGAPARAPHVSHLGPLVLVPPNPVPPPPPPPPPGAPPFVPGFGNYLFFDKVCVCSTECAGWGARPRLRVHERARA